MNARLSLLVLVVFTFMAIWDADRQGKPVRPLPAPQPLSWHLPLPVHPDATAMSPTPIVASEQLAELPVSEHSHVDAPIEQHVNEAASEPAMTVTEVPSIETQPTDVPKLESVAALTAIERAEPDQAETVEATPAASTESAVIAEPVVASESVSDNSVSSERAEEPAVVVTEEATAETTVPTVTEANIETNAPEAAPPENLQTADTWEAERVLLLSRSAMAAHERSVTPISPELAVDEKSEVKDVVAETTEADSSVENVEKSVTESTQRETRETGKASVNANGTEVSSVDSDVDYLPVPKNLGSGTWQLISQDGEMLQITITRPEETSKDVERSEKYATGIDPKGKRWAFVRLQTPTEEEAAKVTEAPFNTEESEPVSRPVQKAATEFFSPSTR